MTTRYATATEFRNNTNIQSSEYSDTKVEQALDSATEEIDLRTGRTWQGAQTVTDEYYDGNGYDFLYLDHPDVQSITALSIDENYDGNYESINTSHIILYESLGKIVLDHVRYSTIAVDYFVKGHDTVKVSYTYGIATPTWPVKQLCILMALQLLNPEVNLTESINRRIGLLRAETIDVV